MIDLEKVGHARDYIEKLANEFLNCFRDLFEEAKGLY